MSEYSETEKSEPELEHDNQEKIEDNEKLFQILNRITFRKWYCKITIRIADYYTLIANNALIDSGADLNCIQRGLIPSIYYEKTKEKLIV